MPLYALITDALTNWEIDKDWDKLRFIYVLKKIIINKLINQINCCWEVINGLIQLFQMKVQAFPMPSRI